MHFCVADFAECLYCFASSDPGISNVDVHLAPLLIEFPRIG